MPKAANQNRRWPVATAPVTDPETGAEEPPEVLVWAICRHAEFPKACRRCPRWMWFDGERCMRGCFLHAQEIANIAQTGNPWRKAPEEIR